MTDVTERTLQLRALMSAKNGTEAFDLRCYIRENLVKFIHEHFPNALPQVRNQQIGCSYDFHALHDAPLEQDVVRR